MRNLRKRRKLIRQMEQANKIPDKLMPQEIKDMLDVAGFRPVIENTPNSAEIKINSGNRHGQDLYCVPDRVPSAEKRYEA